jgi:ribosome biogenesis GTPase
VNNFLQKLGLVPFFTQQLTDVTLLQERLRRVMNVQRTRTTVASDTGDMLVELSPALRRKDAIDRPTVGDWVVLDESLSRIEQVLERKSLFKRLGAGGTSELQPIAANIDTLFIVTSCNEEFKESRLERYLALCTEAGAMPVIVLTKADLIEDADTYVRRARKTKAGVAVEAINALDPASVSGLSAWINNTSTVALVGSSGVGKSTILNTLAGRVFTSTGEIREDDKKGRHTTTHRELHILPQGGLVVDVPGMRELRVAEIKGSIDTVFDDIDTLATQCKFADCNHEMEPGCAVLRAIEEGALDSRRLSNYKKLLRENAHATASLAEKRTQGRDLAKLIKEVKAIKKGAGLDP